jgi:hypothetical protein
MPDRIVECRIGFRRTDLYHRNLDRLGTQRTHLFAELPSLM